MQGHTLQDLFVFVTLPIKPPWLSNGLCAVSLTRLPLSAGAFLGARSIGKSIEEAVEAGHKLGQICVGQAGPTFAWPKQQIL